MLILKINMGVLIDRRLFTDREVLIDWDICAIYFNICAIYNNITSIEKGQCAEIFPTNKPSSKYVEVSIHLNTELNEVENELV